MLRVKIDAINFNKTMNSVVQYGYGFLDGVDMNRIVFNRFLGGFAAEALGNYIDSNARMNPESLHHVYEWNRVGDERARLFDFNVNATKYSITFTGKFLLSKSVSENSTEPFVNKAEIMENRIAITVSPKNSTVLAFENNGEMVFTPNSVYIAHPGGDAVAHSFGRVVDSFFYEYFTTSFLYPILQDLKTADEFVRNFGSAKTGGRIAGVAAGRKYFSLYGGIG